MPALVRSAALQGIEAVPVEVEVDVLPGLPSFTVVGLTDRAIQESRERLTAALINTGYTPPRRKTIVSLAPASLKKEGSLYDLPIALGFLIASRQISIPPERLDHAWFVGELGLDGNLKPIYGLLPIALAAKQLNVNTLYIPAGNAEEAAAMADKITIFAFHSLPELIDHLSRPKDSRQNHSPKKPVQATEQVQEVVEPDIDFADIKGQNHAKRALVVAAAAAHHVLLVGPPGTGKTLLARALVGILPPLTLPESQVVTSLFSVAGLLPAGHGLIRTRPFRSPHHGASGVALIGGGTYPKPGEVSLAHYGVLFLDELPEFSRHVLNQLRQPIEDGIVTVARAAHTLRFPARSMVVGAMNPCPCGFAGSSRKACQCSAAEVTRYQRRLSGPLLDRFDLHILVADIPAADLLSHQTGGQSSVELAQQVAQARVRQQQRQGKPNAELNAKEIRKYCELDSRGHDLLIKAEQRFHLSSRGLHRLLKISRTIADLEGSTRIQPSYIAEALQYREQLAQALPDFI